MASIKYEAAAITSLMTTELNALANGSGAIGAEYDNSVQLFAFGLFELNVTFGTNPTAGNTVDLYLIPAPDGTNYDDAITGASPNAPSPCFVGGFPLRAVTTAQKVPLGVTGYQALIPLPPTKLKAFVINNSGQAFPASGSTVKMIPFRFQTV